MRKKVEILAPAGSMESLTAAVCAGADAVYIGGRRFGARAYADNPEEQELLNAIDYVHLHGRKIYLTVNTLLKDRELKELYDYLLPYYLRGLDAVIVQDIGVMRYIKRCFPGMSVHVSTQATVTHALGAEFFKGLGADRIVPARELSIAEIKDMKKTGMEIECFVHGAMCYCYSGQCLLSSMIGGRSGNRGQCAQPCRLPYSVQGGKAQELLSLKDLCTIDDIPELVDAGIDSFKIEGRMKQPEYVYTAVKIYKKYTELYLKAGRKKYYVSDEDRKNLTEAYQRRGYCGGYYHRQNSREMLSLQRPKKEHENDKKSPEKTKEYKIKEKINGNLILSEGKHATLCMEYIGKEGVVKVNVQGGLVQTAAKTPLTVEKAGRQMRKTGNTEFVFDRLSVHLGNSVFLPLQEVNELRRRGLEELKEKILSQYKRELPSDKPFIIPRRQKTESAGELTFGVTVHSMEQLQEACRMKGIDAVYVDDAAAYDPETVRMIRQAGIEGKKLYSTMPYIFREKAVLYYGSVYQKLLEHYDGALIRNWESFNWLKTRGFAKEIISDYNMYVFNREGKDLIYQAGVKEYTLPVELNAGELKELGPGGVLIVYGYQPVMITANCIKNTTKMCRKKDGVLWITDRYRNKFAVRNNCRYCYNVIYNCAPLMLADMADEISSLGVSGIRLDFTNESPEKMRQIVQLYLRAFKEHERTALPEMEYTRGHFKRGVK